MTTYVVASYGDQYAVIKIVSSGPTYTVMAICAVEANATAIVSALS